MLDLDKAEPVIEICNGWGELELGRILATPERKYEVESKWKQVYEL